MRTYKIYKIVVLLFVISFYNLRAQDQPDFLVTQLDDPYPGYILFDWQNSKEFAYVDNYGYRVHKKIPSNGYNSPYFKLLDNGLWIVFTNSKYFLYNSDFVLVDSIRPPANLSLDFHDVISLNNGRYLLLCKEFVETDLSKEIEGGLPDAVVIHNVLIETDTKGNVFWQWNTKDHVKLKDATEGVDLNGKMIDPVHINSMFETSDGNIVISMRNFDEVAKINRSTGAFIWRMGGSRSKNNQFTIYNDNIDGFIGFSHQHTASILPNGNLLLFDNGNLKDNPYSRAVEYSLNETNKTATKVWEYRYSPDIFMSWMGSAYRLPNGNTLINWGGKKINEVRPDKTIAFEITLYEGFVYRAYKILKDAIIGQNQINSPGDYNFSSNGNETGVSIQVTQITSSSMIYLQRHKYAPHTAIFRDSTFSNVLPYRWVLTRDGKTNLSGKFKINVQSVQGIENPAKITIYKREKENEGEFYPLVTTYNSGTGQLIADFTGFGEFVLVSNVLSKPSLISPVNNISVPVHGELKWQKVHGADRYQVQLDTSFSFASPIINTIVQQQVTHNYSGLKQKSKYYWRVRALNSKDTSEWSNIFSFTTISPPPELIYPRDKAEGILLADTLRWLEIDEQDNYFVQIATTSDFKNPVVSIPYHSTPYITIKNLRNETTYYWRVLVNHPQEPSDWSAIRSFKTTFAAPTLNIPFNQAINVKIPCYFTWNSEVSVDTYTFEISEYDDFLDLQFTNSGITSKSIDVSKLDNNTEYFWRVKSKKGNIYSDWSQVNKFTTALVTPKLMSPGNNSTEVPLIAVLSWEMPMLNVNYHIQLATDINFNAKLLDTLLYSRNSYDYPHFESNKSYFWRVRIIDGEKQSEWSNTWTFMTGNSNKLRTPSLSYPWNFAFVQIEGILLWTKVSEATQYRLQIDQDESFTKPLINTLINNDTTFWHSKLDYNQTYFWRVKAYNSIDSSDWSNVRRFTTMAKVYQPTLLRPGNDQMQVPLEGYVECFGIPAIDYYVFQISETPNFSSIIKEENVGLNRRMQYSNLENNKRYYWRAAFFRDGELSSWSTVWTFLTETEDTINAPRALNPFDYTLVNPIFGVSIRWSSVQDADSYELSLSSNWSFDDKVVKFKIHKDTVYNLTELEYKSFYYWRVSAINDNAQSVWSNSRNFYTMLQPPIILYPAENADDIPFDGRLVWAYEDTTVWFRAQIATDIDFNYIVMDIDTVRVQYHNYSLEKNTEYYLRLRAYDFFNRSVWTSPIKFKTGTATGVADDLRDLKFSIYPNPAKDYIFVHNEIIKSIRVIDLLGNEVYSSNTVIQPDNKIDISALPSGVYSVIISDNENRIFNKVFIKTE